MKKLLRVATLIFALCATLFITSNKVQAVAVNYNALKYGTNETSMASAYYARPAQVNVVNGAYVVTMTIITNKSLSPWPVVVNSIDGQAPQAVSKTQSGDNYLYSYSFTTNNLSRTISSNITVSIPNVYTANHNISFTFDTGSLPSLAQPAAQTQNNNATSQTNNTNQNKQAGANQGNQANTQTPNNAQASQSQASSSSTNSSSSASSSSASSEAKKKNQDKKKAKKDSSAKKATSASKKQEKHSTKERVNVQSSRQHALRNGIIIIIVIAAIAGYVLYRAKRKEDK